MNNPSEASLRRRGRILLTAGAALIGVTGAALLLEGGARWLNRQPAPPETAEGAEPAIEANHLPGLDAAFRPHPELWWALEPNLVDHAVEGRSFGNPVSFTVSTNARGLRGGPLAEKKRGRRILCVGDSTTFGLGVAGDASWPVQLEARLDAGAGRFEVVNAGVPGYTAFQGLRYLDKEGLALAPDLVVVCFGFNDFSLWDTQTDIEKAIAQRASAERTEEDSFSDFFVLARRAVREAGEALERAAGKKTSRMTPGQYHATIEEIVALCRRENLPVVLMLWPPRSRIAHQNAQAPPYEAILEDVAVDKGVPLIDLRPVFAGATEPVYLDPIHVNARGCALVADAAASVVRDVLAASAGGD